MINRAVGILAAALCGALGPEESEAVMGDLLEAHASGLAMLMSLCGLVGRRQLHALRSPLAWLVLVCIAAPAGFILGSIANHISRLQSVFLWMYLNNWTPQYLQAGWFRSELLPLLGGMVCWWLMLAGASWIIGAVLARALSSMALLNVTVVVIGVLTSGLSGHAIFQLIPASTRAGAAFDGNAPVFAHSFYRICFPFLVQITCVAAPLLWATCVVVPMARRVGDKPVGHS